MIHVNTVVIAGRLTRDPQVRQTTSGTAVGSFGIAVNERYRTRDGEDREKTAFTDVEVWGRQAESCAEYLTKGAPVLVEGKLQSESWEDRSSGERRSRILVRANRVHFLSTGSGGAACPSRDDDNASVARRADERTRSGRGRRSERVGDGGR